MTLWFALLYLPILVMVGFSFNQSESLPEWGGFSLRWCRASWNNQEAIGATVHSFQIASIAAVIATLVATLAALATTRTESFRGQAVAYALINQPQIFSSFDRLK